MSDSKDFCANFTCLLHAEVGSKYCCNCEPDAATLPAAPAPTEQAGPMMQVAGGPPLPSWYCRAIYEGWKARAGLESTYDDFVNKYGGRFLDWESIGSLYSAKVSSNGTVTKDVIDAALAARQAPTEQPKALPTLRVPITDDEMVALRRFDECARDGAGYDVSTDMMKALASIGLVRHLSAGRYEHTSFGLAVLSGDVARQAPDNQDARQIADLILGNEGMRVTSPLESSTGFGDDIEHRFEIGDGISRTGVVITLTKLRALKSIAQEKAQ